MLRRLILGLIEGLVIGIALGVGAARGLGLLAPSGVVLALLGGASGFVVGLVAGRPVWGQQAKTEALLKAAVGALGGAGLAFGLAHWLKVPLDLRALQLGAGPAGALPTAALPLVSTVLALFFELDNDAPQARVVARSARRRLASEEAAPARGDLSDQGDSHGDAERKLGKR